MAETSKQQAHRSDNTGSFSDMDRDAQKISQQQDTSRGADTSSDSDRGRTGGQSDQR